MAVVDRKVGVFGENYGNELRSFFLWKKSADKLAVFISFLSQMWWIGGNRRFRFEWFVTTGYPLKNKDVGYGHAKLFNIHLT